MEVKKFNVKGNVRKRVDGGLLTEGRDSSGSDSDGKVLMYSLCFPASQCYYFCTFHGRRFHKTENEK